MGALGEGVAGGAISGGTMMAGMTSGMAIGALAGGGVFDAATVPFGAAAGLVAGYYAANRAKAGLGIPAPEQMSANVRPYGYAGDMFGSGMSMAGEVALMAKAGVTSSIPFVQKILGYARYHPAAFLAGEASTNFGAGTGAAASETVAPGNTPARIALSVGGAIINPAFWLQNGGRFAASKFGFYGKLLTNAGQKNLVAARAQAIALWHGEDPQRLADVLTTPGIADVPGITSAQKSGSPALAAMEKSLTDSSQKFGSYLHGRAKDALTTMRNAMHLLAHGGTPAEVTGHAETRAIYFRTLIQGVVNDAVDTAVTAAKKLTVDSQRTRAQLGKIAQDAVAKALTMARAAEKELWSKVNKTIPWQAPEHSIAAYKQVGEDVLLKKYGQGVDPVTERFFASMMEEPNPLEEGDTVFGEGAAAEPKTTSGELIKMRGHLLNEARMLRGATPSNDKMARVYDELADGVLSDLNEMGAKFGDQAYDAARQFTKELHDAFQRTFAGSATSVTRNGSGRVAPEEFLDKALGSGGTGGDLQLQELEDATKFMALHGMDSPEALKNVGVMLSAQQRLLRFAASDIVNPVTKRIDPLRVAKFMRDNQSILDRFPEVRGELEGAMKGEQQAQDVLSHFGPDGTGIVSSDQLILGKLLDTDDPVGAVAKVMNGAQPLQDFVRMVELAENSGAPAVKGLTSAVLQNAVTKSVKGGELNFGMLDDALNRPVRAGLPSLLQMMRSTGLLDVGESGRLTQLLAAGQKAEGVEELARGGPGIPLPTQLSEGVQVAIKTLGSHTGGRIGEAVLGRTTLISQAAFSGWALKLATRAGVVQATDLLQQAVENPKVMADLLRAPTTQAEAIMWGRRLHMYTFNSIAEGEAPEPPKESDPYDEPPPPEAAASEGSSGGAPPTPPPPPAATAPSPAPYEPPGKALLPVIQKLEGSANNATSRKGAIGRNQIEPSTAHAYGFSDATPEKLKDPAYNDYVATHILSGLLHQFGGNTKAVLVAYNAGPTVARRWLAAGEDNSVLPTETQKYLEHASRLGLQ
ncbi:MAG TPA: transglycosylase SLT domain-containing protein [Rhodanobacter sp.]|nr:transglycosylase SLT domain-containing protein [Rhodanobacter sp.]